MTCHSTIRHMQQTFARYVHLNLPYFLDILLLLEAMRD